MSTPAPTPPEAGAPGNGPGLASTIALYAVARIAVVAVVAALLSLAGVPFLLSLLIGLVVALPLSMVLFRGLRARLDAAVEASRARRADVRAHLRGDDGPPRDVERAPSDDAPQGETDGRRD
ncbi:hypothetical protein PSU4_10910 [Pseudonocardia sulfidoxydans NBRC 16205]|uniref:DUF4229 domain-containing protein n=1 Tax=Pseudonocardia sulfidoxydans NBRC 16205 TaxID=1223511 RepID=A0A511DC54_9PSEU|nr:DUF4229 domain-containing protein [Pseudonocardia sulfidoxydans]GEL22137.1 hypothetical protein PSU4_10910 [Pseudonocardia sulfidoxydans NBRC 16205]